MKKLYLVLLLSCIFGMQAIAQDNPSNPKTNPESELSKDIVGGVAVNISQYPYQVSVQTSGGSHFCGGSIIDKEWILTAQHCVVGLSSGDVRIRAGATSRSSGGQVRSVNAIVKYPGYTSTTAGKDIALLRLSTPLDLTDANVATIQWVTASEASSGMTNAGELSVVSGWGTTSSGGSSPTNLRAVDVDIISNANAQLRYRQHPSYSNWTMTSDQLAAGVLDVGGRDACQGDSGGPLVVQTADGSGVKLAGVVSWGLGCAEADYPGMYARVSSFDSWIGSYINYGYPSSTPPPPLLFDPPLTAPTDLEAFKPYYYNLRWSDVNNPYLTGTIEVQKNGYMGNTNAYYTVATINDLHATSHYLGTSAPSGKYRLRFTDQFNRVVTTQPINTDFSAPGDVVVFRPYYYNLRWTDPNEPFWTGTIQVQRNYHPTSTSYVTIATINDIHTTSYYLGTAYPEFKYRLKFTSSTGIVKYSNVADQGQLKAATDLEVFRPYYYNLRWTDPNSSLISGTIQIQRHYQSNPTYYSTVATVDIHATSYYIGTSYDPNYTYRLKMTDQFGNVVYSNYSVDNSGGRIGAILDPETNVEVFPVPAVETLWFTLRESKSQHYTIMDAKGVEVLTGTIAPDTYHSKQSVDVRELKAGMYFFMIDDERIKFIKAD